MPWLGAELSPAVENRSQATFRRYDSGLCVEERQVQNDEGIGSTFDPAGRLANHPLVP